MKKQEVVMIAIIMIIVVLLMVVVVNNKKHTEEREENKIEEVQVEILPDGTKVNKSNKLGETKYLEGLEITNIQVIYKNGETVITATVTNKSGMDKELMPITLTVYDREYTVIEEIKQGLISPVKVGESVNLNIGTSLDWSNAYDIKIEKQ